MGKLLKRWYVWLGLVLLLGLAGSVVLICSSQSRITRARYEQLHDGMSRAEVYAILGEPGDDEYDNGGPASRRSWCYGPDFIIAAFNYDKLYKKEIHVATAWETLHWYVKKGAAKIGVKWD
jgi:hypothetical protein